MTRPARNGPAAAAEPAEPARPGPAWGDAFDLKSVLQTLEFLKLGGAFVDTCGSRPVLRRRLERPGWPVVQTRLSGIGACGAGDTMGYMKESGTFRVKAGLAEMLKGGVIMDVVTAEQARIAEEARAAAVMALERVPADIQAAGGAAWPTLGIEEIRRP